MIRFMKSVAPKQMVKMYDHAEAFQTFDIVAAFKLWTFYEICAGELDGQKLNVFDYLMVVSELAKAAWKKQFSDLGENEMYAVFAKTYKILTEEEVSEGRQKMLAWLVGLAW